MNKKFAFFTLLFFFTACRLMATTHFVDINHNSGPQTGSSWSTAFTDLQPAIAAATAGDSIWVAQGTYMPATAYIMKEGVKIFGGFLNTNVSFNQRDWQNNITILDRNGDYVIRNNNTLLTSASVIDGFTISHGATGISNVNSSPLIRNCIFKNNHQAIRFSSDSATVINCQFSNNISPGIMVSGSYLTLKNCSFTSNSARAIEAQQQVILSIDSCDFFGNTSNGGSAVTASNSDLKITNSSFSNNRATHDEVALTGYQGGAFSFSSCTLVMDHCILSFNDARIGGAISSDESALTITNSSFYNNTAATAGSAIYYSSPNSGAASTVVNCDFYDNGMVNPDAYYQKAIGGAIYTKALHPLAFSNCTFSNNRAYSGGAIYNEYVVKVDNSIFKNNTAAQAGAGIYNFSLSSGDVINSTFTGGHAKHGGAIYNLGTYFLNIANCVIAKNMADSFGGAIFNSTAHKETRIINCTIVQNTAAFGGGAMYNTAASGPEITNCIILENNSGLSNSTDAQVKIGYSLIQGQAADPVLHMMDDATLPSFVDAANLNYHLLPNSPCINKGVNDSIPAGVVTDRSGNNRIYADTVDLGAYEYITDGPILTLGNDTAFCSGASFTLDAQNAGSSYLWNTGETTQTIQVHMPGTYTVAVTNTAGTTGDDISIAALPAPIVNLGNDTAVAPGSTFTLNAGNTGVAYLWNTGETTSAIHVNTDGTYSVLVTGNNGCNGSDSIQVSFNALAIKEVTNGMGLLTVSPNPANGFVILHISNSNLLPLSCILTDLYGRYRQIILVNKQDQKIALTGLPSGIYLLKTENGIATKIVKQ